MLTTNYSDLLRTLILYCYGPLLVAAALFHQRAKFRANMFGIGHSEFTSAEDTVPINLKSDDADDGPGGQLKRQISLLQLCKETTPPCRLNPLLFNGHLQTAWAGLRGEDVPIHYKRRVFKSTHPPYPGQFAVDFVIPAPSAPRQRDRHLPPRTHDFTDQEFADIEASNPTKPLLIVLHGLSGGSHEGYLRHLLRPLTSTEGGWDACVVNARGCAWSKVTSNVLYNARATWDVRQFVAWAQEQWPERRLFGMGFSLGACILTNYIAEDGEDCKLEAAVVISNPWNLDVADTHLRSTWIGKNVYSAAMGTGMRKLFERHIDQVSQNKNIDVEKVRKSKYLFEWDRLVQCPTWGYPTESAYYRDASCVDTLFNIRIPILALHATDDPIVSNSAVPYEEIKLTPYIVMCATSIGGHLSWFELGGDRWYSRAACAFLQKFARDTDGPSPPKKEDSEKSTVIEVNKPRFDPMRRRLHFRE